MAGSTEEAGQGQNRVCLRAGAVSMEEDAFWSLIGVTKKYGNLAMCYVDDVVITTPTLEDHIERLDEVFA